MDSGSGASAATGFAKHIRATNSLDPGELREKLRRLAFERLDYEVFGLLQSSPTRPRLDAEARPRLDAEDLRVLASVLREGRKQLGGLRDPGKWELEIDQLVDSVSTIMEGFEVPAKASNTPPFREFFLAAIEWYVALYTTRHAQRIEPTIIELSRLDMAAIPELRERLAVELAAIGFRRPLPNELELFVCALEQRAYLLTPLGVLRVLAFTLHSKLREPHHLDLKEDWLPLWVYHFGLASRIRRQREQTLSLKDDVHTRLGLLIKFRDIVLGRFGGMKASLMLFLIKLDHWLFIKGRLGAKRHNIAWLFVLRLAARRMNGFARNLRAEPATGSSAATPRGLRTLEQPTLTGTHYDLLVSRTQGGFGDVITMRPGLIEAARRKRRGRVIFATNRDFFPVFSVDDPIDLVDIERTAIDLRSFGQWVNLSDCPAARVEAAELPRIRSNRIDIFARAVGARFPLFGRRRFYPVAFDEPVREAAKEFVLRHAPTGTRIGIQLRSAESYKDVPAILEVARVLSAKYTVFVFDSRPIPRQADDRFIVVDNQPLRTVLAMLPQMHVLVTPDSSFMHVAGVCNIPCLALFGSADGRVRCKPYPSVRYLDARKSLACVPCWRNEVEKCRLGNGYTSLCLTFLTVPAIVSAVEEMLVGVEAMVGGR